VTSLLTTVRAADYTQRPCACSLVAASVDVYGLTGGIGSGKSAVADLLEQYGVPVVSADELARIVVARGSEGLANVVEAFGSGVLDERGELDRRKMASIVFEDPAKRQQLEGILHPRIRERFEQVLDAIEKSGHTVAVYEVPLLFEKNLQNDMKAVILVTADESIRIARVCARDDVTEAEVRARMSAQLPEDIKRRRADYVIVNDGDLDDLRREVEFVLARFLRVGPLRPMPGTPRTVTQPVPVVPESGAPTEPLQAGGTARLFGFPPAADALDDDGTPPSGTDVS
jgi:dephospho-CoA kinase